MMVMTCALIAATIKTVAAQDLNLNDATQFYFGYIDAVMDIDLQNQMDQCASVVPHAQNTINEALDEMDRTTDFWMPINKKIEKITDALGKMVMMTPTMVPIYSTAQPLKATP